MKLSVSALLTTVSVVLATPVALPAPPGIPAEDSARAMLESLRVTTPGSGDGYVRSKFPTWEAISGNCNAREWVLKRDGEDVVVDNRCIAGSGTWTSPYDGAVITEARNIDIDHMVPLKNSWISGASAWTPELRKRFANDVSRPQLWAVSSSSNRSKGDSSPDRWKPPLRSFWCTYAKSWITVKGAYDLTITNAEKSALGEMLDTC